MNKIKSLVLAAIGLLCSMSVSAHDFEVDGIYYNITSNADLTVAVTFKGDYSFSYSNEYSGTVTIPESVTYNEKTYSVTSIGDDAFYECNGLTSITIPNSVTGIGSWAFYYCSGLTSITIPNSVTSIGGRAFSYCSALTSITIPNSVTSIGDDAFYGTAWYKNQPYGLIYINEVLYKYKGTMPQKTSIEVKGGTVSISPKAFYDCDGLTSITIGDSVTSIGDDAFNSCSALTFISIPESVTSIGDKAFYNCTNLTSITIPNSVTSIGFEAFYGTAWYDKQPDGVVYAGNVLYKYKGTMPWGTSIEVKGGTVSISPEAFRGCYDLTSITIPNSVISIGDKAFYDCIRLTSITIPNSVTSIGDEAFYCCDRLTSITLPNSLTSIGDWTFYGSGLTSITIPNSVTSIGDYAFNSCYYLTSVTIPNSVIHIGDGAFYRCSRLSSITIPSSVTSIRGYTFYCCTSITSIAIPSSVTSIGDKAFSGCSGLTSITIPNSVTSIGPEAFANCENLKQLISYAEVPPVCGLDVFYGVNTQECTLYVPYGAKTAYSEAEYWKEFTNIEELAPSHYELTDGVAYDRTSNCFVNSVTYTRTLPNLHWNALYVPFELPYDVIADRYDVAYINDVNGYDTDDNGTIDDLAMEIIKIKGGTLKANYPYLIKAKTAADKAMSITVEDATLYAAEENSVRCSSVYQNYAVTGIYTKKTAEELAGKLAISTSGAWQPLAAGTALNPFRLYLSIENLDDSPLKVETSAMSHMRIVEHGETTGVETIIPAQQREDVIIDLSGRRVKQPVKGGVYIINGKKQIF